jgi:hypothetical protein
MIWSKEALQSLSEEDLCIKILVPLFRAMGYESVRYYHGGVLEQGKDIVMCRRDELRGRINYAVVVKAQKITGSASTTSVVAFQAQQALGSTFVDEQTNEAHSVHEVLIITSHEITKEGHEALHSSLAGSKAHHNVAKIDGDQLWKHVRKYLPHEAIFSSLAEANKALNEADPDYGYIVKISPNEVHFTAFPKREEVGPIPVFFEPGFPDTPEGRLQEKAFRRFVASGKQAEVSTEYLKIKGLPAPIHGILQNLPEGTLILGPKRSSLTLAVTLLFKKTSGEELTLFPLIEFGANYGGEEEITLSNEQQAIPFKFKLAIPLVVDRAANFHFDFSAADSTATSLLRSSEFLAALAEGGVLSFEEYDTGKRLFSLVTSGTVEHPGKGFIDLLRKLIWVQRQLGVVIHLPERVFFTDEDIKDILEIETILKSGHFLGSCSEVAITFKPGAPRQLLKEHPDGFLGEMKIVQEYRYNILGTELLLGPVELRSQRVRIDPRQLEELSKRTEWSDTDEAPAVRLIPEEGSFDVKFRNWPRESGGQESEPESAEPDGHGEI